jgi:hypothetical protein
MSDDEHHESISEVIDLASDATQSAISSSTQTFGSRQSAARVILKDFATLQSGNNPAWTCLVKSCKQEGFHVQRMLKHLNGHTNLRPDLQVSLNKYKAYEDSLAASASEVSDQTFKRSTAKAPWREVTKRSKSILDSLGIGVRDQLGQAYAHFAIAKGESLLSVEHPALAEFLDSVVAIAFANKEHFIDKSTSTLLYKRTKVVEESF